MNKLRGVRNIPSVMKLRRPRRVRAQGESAIFNELAQLSQEKVRLNEERENWQERIEWIDARLREIEELEESLRRQVAPKEEIALDAQDVKQAAGKGRHEVIVKY